MPVQRGTTSVSNLDPLQIFNVPSPVPQRGGGAGMPATGGIFDAFIPRPGGNGTMPMGGGAPFNPAQMYSVPTEVNSNIRGTSAGVPQNFDLQARNLALRQGGASQTPQAPSYAPIPIQNYASFYAPGMAPAGTIGGPPLGSTTPGGNLTPPINMPMGGGGQPFQFQMPQQPQGDSAAAQWMANLMNNNQYLQNFAQNGQPVQLQNPYLAQIAQSGLPTSLAGSYLNQWAQNGQPVNALPAWQSYIDSMQRNVQANQAQLMEMFNSQGGYQSTSFGNAAVDYQTQTAKDQNALLAQMGYQSLSDALGRQFQAGGSYDTLKAGLSEAAASRQLQAGGTLDQMQFQSLSDAMMRQYGAAGALGQQAYGAGSQLSNFDFQSQMAQYQAGLQASMLAAQQAQGLQGSAMGQLGQYGSGAANQLLMNALGGVNSLFGGSQNALSQMFGTSSQVPAQLLQAYLGQSGQGIQGYQALMNSYLQNLGLGSQMGGQQYNTLQNQLGSLYQEWLRTQSQYNPLLPYMFQGATGYVPTQSTNSPGFWDYFTNILGAGVGAAGSIIGGGMAGGLFSDIRMKENVVPIGQIRDVPIYEYEYVGFPGKQIGVIAQEVIKTHPNVVYTDESGTMSVDYARLAGELMLAGGVN